MKIHRTIYVEVTPEDMGETWPDVRLEYPFRMLRPDSVTVELNDFTHEGRAGEAGEMEYYSATVGGYRVLQGGGTTVYLTDRYGYRGDDMPDWLQRAIDAALKAARQQ